MNAHEWNKTDIFSKRDNVQWDKSQEVEAQRKVEKQAEHKISETVQEKLKEEANICWDKFYDLHQNR